MLRSAFIREWDKQKKGGNNSITPGNEHSPISVLAVRCVGVERETKGSCPNNERQSSRFVQLVGAGSCFSCTCMYVCMYFDSATPSVREGLSCLRAL